MGSGRFVRRYKRIFLCADSSQAGYSSVDNMKQHLNTDQLRALRRVYTSTQRLKKTAIEKMISRWGPDVVDRLHLNEYSDLVLRASVKAAEQIGMEEANRLLGQISLRRLCLNKRGWGSAREVTTGDWQDLVAALASDEAKSEVLQILDLTDDDQVRLDMMEPMSIFKQRIPVAISAYSRRRLRENNNPQVEIDDANGTDPHCETIQVAKRARTYQKY